MAVSGTSGSLQIAGIASGLDTDGIIEQLINIDFFLSFPLCLFGGRRFAVR